MYKICGLGVRTPAKKKKKRLNTLVNIENLKNNFLYIIVFDIIENNNYQIQRTLKKEENNKSKQRIIYLINKRTHNKCSLTKIHQLPQIPTPLTLTYIGKKTRNGTCSSSSTKHLRN